MKSKKIIIIFSILLIIPYSILVTFAGMYYYVKVLRFDRKTAFFSSTPGGVVEMVILGEEQKADTAKITLVQSSRLLFVVLSLPFIIQYVFHLDISGNQLITKALKDTDLVEFFYLIIIGLIFTFKSIKPLIGNALGTAYAQSFGISQSKLKISIIVASSLLSASVTAFLGPILFIGVVVPHFCRMIWNPAQLWHQWILNMILGIFIMQVFSIISELSQFPINFITTFFGIPVILLMLMRKV